MTVTPKPPAGRGWIYAIARELAGDGPDPGPAEAVVSRGAPPDGFPPSIPVDTITFTDWSGAISVAGVQVARIASADDVAAVCCWAAQHGSTVRAVGHSHNWSPILLDGDTPPGSEVMLVDTAQLDGCSLDASDGNPLATFGTGVTLEAASAYLETCDNHGASTAPGYAFPQLPAPGSLTLGGALAIGAHGTLVPTAGGTADGSLMGCLSNLITGFDAVVTDPDGDPGTYAVRHFRRDEADAAAFLVHLGRAFLTSVTLLVVPNYHLQLHCLFPEAAALFGAPRLAGCARSNRSSRPDELDTYGRIEVLWFPHNERTFVQCNEVKDDEGRPPSPGRRPVTTTRG